jgi:hypothetical protein
MPTSESTLLARIAYELLLGAEELPQGSSSAPFLRSTATKLFKDVLASLSLSDSTAPTLAQQQPVLPEPSARPDASVASHSKRDFTRWCKGLSLPAGHQFYTVGGGQNKVLFKLVWGRDGKALLEAACPDGVILRGLSPNGILKAYMKKTTGKEVAVDGWRRLSMRSPDGLTQWPIRDPEWDKYEWVNGKFVNTEDIRL